MRLLLILALSACDPGPSAGVAASVATSGAEPAVVDTGSLPDASSPSFGSTTEWQGLSCPTPDPEWTPDDVCGDDEGCSLVLLRVKCGLIEQYDGELHACFARDEGGPWTPCKEFWPGADHDQSQIFDRIEEIYGYSAHYGIRYHADLEPCVREDAEVRYDGRITAEGVTFMHGRTEHNACDLQTRDGRYGGVEGLGSVFLPIQPECSEELVAKGWDVYDHPEFGVVAAGSVFSMSRVFTGELSALY